ncbi:MAG: hypothetical protein Tsb0013_06320 [Phycisphaerales bacterium]
MLAALAGCQSYKPSPLDLDAYRDALASRVETGPVVGAGSSGARGFDVRDGVSPGEAETIALFYNPDLRIRRLEAGVALASYEHADLWDDPVFGFNLADIVSANTVSELGFTLGFSIPVSGRLDVAKDRAGAAYDEALARVAHAEWTLRHDVRRACIDHARAHERVRVLGDALDRAESVLGITTSLEDAGALTRAQARLVRAEHATIAADLSDARAERGCDFTS